jgi:S-adenosylmethionine:tRNA ribosyltransferase-isomerase
MKLSLFNYHLPKELIAQTPAEPRDTAGLLVYNSNTQGITNDKFFNLPKYLQSGDVLVFNNTKVFPARLIMKKPTGGKIEIFLLKEIKSGVWECLVGGRLPAVVPMDIGTMTDKGQFFLSLKNLKADVLKKFDDGRYLIKFNLTGEKFLKFIEKNGETPLPPYIKTKDNKNIRKKYQTIYAKYFGSVAAPTAGLHFTKKLLANLKKRGIQIEFATLHVGLGTFQPVKTDEIEKHKMHAEFAILDKETSARLNYYKKQGRRIIAVGTTSARLLEAVADKNGKLKPIKKEVNIFIYPGYKFKFVDALITNFHLPKSTLLMLVSSFLGQGKYKTAGIKIMQKIYATAIKKKYRFYSFGDGMLIE